MLQTQKHVFPHILLIRRVLKSFRPIENLQINIQQLQHLVIYSLEAVKALYLYQRVLAANILRCGLGHLCSQALRACSRGRLGFWLFSALDVCIISVIEWSIEVSGRSPARMETCLRELNQIVQVPLSCFVTSHKLLCPDKVTGIRGSEGNQTAFRDGK